MPRTRTRKRQRRHDGTFGFLRSGPSRRRCSRRCSTSTSASWPGCCSGRSRRSCATTSGSRRRSRDCSPPSRCSADRSSGRCWACSATASAAGAPALIGMALTLVPLVARLAVRASTRRTSMCSGCCSASPAPASRWRCRWRAAGIRREYQGLAMGIAGAGNSGTLLATLFAPRLAERFGWAATFGFAMLPLALVFVAVRADRARTARAASRRRPLRDYARRAARARHAVAVVPLQPHLRRLRRLRQLPHHVLPRAVPACRASTAGDFTTLVVVAGSLLRPVGGWLADRVGGYRLLVLLLARRSPRASASSRPRRRCPWPSRCSSSAWACSAWATARCSSSCRSAFPIASGIVTGIVGAAGGLGGFFLPTVLGVVEGLRPAATRAGSARLRGACSSPGRSCCSSSARGGRSAGRPTAVERAGVYRVSRTPSAARRRTRMSRRADARSMEIV